MSKLDQNHINFLAGQFAKFENNISKLTEQLKKPEIAEEYNFDVIEVTRQAVSWHIKREDFIDKIMLYQTEYLSDFKDMALAHKKERAKELIKLYNSIDKITKTDGKLLAETTRLDKKLMVLRDIRAEMGDDIERIAQALEKDKTVNVNVSAQEAILERYEPINDNIGTDEIQTITH